MKASETDCLPNQSNAKFSIIMIVLNGMPFIEFALKSIYDAAYEIIIIEGAVENCMFSANSDGSSTDGTVPFIKAFPDPQNKIKLIQGCWPEKCEMQNKALEHVTGDYVWLVDSDEVYRKEDVAKIAAMVSQDPSITQINFICHNFWKGFDYTFVSKKLFTPAHHFRRIFKFIPGAHFVSHRPPSMVHPGAKKTTEQMHCMSGLTTWRQGIAIYHYSYVLNAQVMQKIELYRRYGWDKTWGIDMQSWYNDFYTQWTPNKRLVLERRHPIWTGDNASFSVPFKGQHPEGITDYLKGNPGMTKQPTRLFAMRHVVDAVEDVIFRNLPGPPIIALETGTIRSYDEKHESTRYISQALGRGGKLYSVDINPESIRISRDICSDAENIEWVLSDSLSYLRKNCPEKLHFVLLDSVNDPETIFSEFAMIAPHMASNGIVIVDDAGIRADGSGPDSAPAQKGHRIWQFLNQCGVAFDVLETLPGHRTQIKVRFTPENTPKILARVPLWTGQKAKQPARQRAEAKSMESDRYVKDSEAAARTGAKSSLPDLHIVIDGVIFQLQAGRPRGISRVWRNLIRALSEQMPQARITFLQREGFPGPVSVGAIHTVPLFELGHSKQLDADDEMLRCVCRDLKADIFMSTYYTRAPGVVNVVMIHDMIPELFGYDLSQPEWLAKQRVIDTGDAFMCVSQATENDFRHCYPQTESSPMVVVPNGLDDSFKSVKKSDVGELQKKLGLTKDYLLMVGNRRGYKGGTEFIKALSNLHSKAEFSVLCVGGETQHASETQIIHKQLDIRYVGQLTDSELSAAYHGAKALMVPSKYEGFGLPVLEAMACGCPVIAEESPAVVEVGGGAVYFCDLSRPDRVDQALQKVSESALRKQMIANGRVRASRFNWAETAKRICQFVEDLMAKRSILLTAVVSTYNAARFIEGCLEDLERQTISDRIEIIVVDSASEQDESALIRDFQRKYTNIKYIRTPTRETVFKAWNRGIKFAVSKYVTNANTDDRHRQDAFEQMVHVLEQDEQIALVYADVIKTHTANETFRDCTPTGMFHWHDWDRSTLLKKGCFIGPQPVWRKAVHQEYGFFNENYEVSADFEFWLRISQTKEFFHISKPLGLYLDRIDSIEHANTLKKQQEDQDILQRYRQAAKEKRVIGILSKSDKDMYLEHRPIQQDCTEAVAVSSDLNKSTNEAIVQGEHIMNSPENIFNSIKYLVENAHEEAAFWAMEKLLADFPKHARLHNEMAVLAYEHTDMQKALVHFKEATAIDPQNAIYLKNLADFYYVVEKDADNALMHYESVLNIDPNNIESLTMAGHVSLSLHRYSQGQQYYQRALGLDPQNTEVRLILEKMSHPALDQNGSTVNVDDLYAAAQTKVQDGDREKAISLLEQLLIRNDAHAPAHNDLGVLQYENGNLQAALTHYERAAGLQPENEIFQKNLADFYLAAMGELEKAMQTYLQVLKLNPRDVEVLLSCGQICMGLSKADDARDFINIALKTEPWNENAQQMLSQLDLSPELTDSVHTDLYERAKEKASKGDLDGAIQDLSQYTATTAPDNANAHNDLGVLYFESGDKNKALAAYEQAMKLEPNDPTYTKNLADFYLVEQGRTEEAMKLYLRVLEDNPQDIEPLIACGLICTSLGQVEDAKFFYNRVLNFEPWNEIAQNALIDLNPKGQGSDTEDALNVAAR